jgi:ribonuclease D
VNLFGSPQVVKIVHDGNDDIENLSASFLNVVDKEFKIEIKGRISLAEIFKSNHQSKYSNLAFICKTIFNKELSKAEQLSDWEDRPLLESQLHYAALDCFILLQAFQILNS